VKPVVGGVLSMPQVRKSGTAWERRLDDYAYTKGLDGPGWAWEFLRRNPNYGRDFAEHLATVPTSTTHQSGVKVFILPELVKAAEKWGLAAFANPAQSALDASLFWLPAYMNSVVFCHAKPANDNHPEILSLSHFQGQKSVLVTPICEHILIQKSHTTARLIVTGVSLLRDECVLTFSFDGIKNTILGLAAMRELQSLLCRSPEILAPSRPSYLKYRDYLIGLDGHVAQRSYRDIAEVLYGADRVREVWTNETRHLKDKVRRAVQAGIELMNSGYVKLLN
jgi:hypothetical protein